MGRPCLGFFMTFHFRHLDMPKNMTMDSRLEYRFGQGTVGNHSSSSSHSPTKESLKNSER